MSNMNKKVNVENIDKQSERTQKINKQTEDVIGNDSLVICIDIISRM